MTDLSALVPFAQSEMARRHLLDFGELICPGFESPSHVAYIASQLEAVERGDIRWLIINVPPRHGKSLLAGKVFPAWFTGRNPTKETILASYALSRASENSLFARQYVEDQRWPFEARLSRESYGVEEWHVSVKGRIAGGVKAIGVGGGITGRGGDLIVCDDIQHDESTQTERESTWKWFSQVLIPRLNPGGRMVVIATRWHVDDIVGRLMDAEDGGKWAVVRLPAIADGGDVLGRPAGQALWPARTSLQELSILRSAMGSRAFSAQFQQNPVPSEGTVFRAQWFERRYKSLPRMTFTVSFVDSAWKKATGNDRSAVATWGTDGVNYYLIDCWAGKMEYPDLKRQVADVYSQMMPDQLLVEDKASGTGIIQELSAETNLPIKGVQVDGDKIVRAQRVTPMFEAGKVYLPEDSAAPWVEDWVQEHLRFPNGRYDDQVDTTSGALAKLREYTTAKPFGFSMSFNRNQDRW